MTCFPRGLDTLNKLVPASRYSCNDVWGQVERCARRRRGGAGAKDNEPSHQREALPNLQHHLSQSPPLATSRCLLAVTKVRQSTHIAHSPCSLKAVEHGIKADEAKPNNDSGRRPDLSTFYSALDQLDDSREARHNPHALPTPADLAALYDMLADAIALMQGSGDTHIEMIDQLRNLANNPPREVHGVPDSFLDALDRVPKKALKKDDQCNICGLPFLDGECCLLLACLLPRRGVTVRYTPGVAADDVVII